MIALGFYVGAAFAGTVGVIIGIVIGLEMGRPRRARERRADLSPALAKAHWIRRKR